MNTTPTTKLPVELINEQIVPVLLNFEENFLL